MKLSFIVLLLLSNAFASNIDKEIEKNNFKINDCREKAWPHSREIESKNLLQNIFENESRTSLIAYSFYELFHKNEKNMAVPILFYLSQTEKDRRLREFYKGMGYMALKQETTLLHAMEEWPNRRAVIDFSSKKNVVCNMYSSSLGPLAEGLKK